MIESNEGTTANDNKKKWLNEQHTDRVGTQLYMSPEQVNNLKLIFRQSNLIKKLIYRFLESHIIIK